MKHHDETPSLLDQLVVMREAQRMIGVHVLAMLHDLRKPESGECPGIDHAFCLTLVALLNSRLRETPKGVAISKVLEIAISHLFPSSLDDDSRDDDIPF